ncbi:MAG: hypothetical protein A2068_02910 [Ignavibacteria bacterium GWB2_35_6b]|nr:MAG: hypothetical protein A2068_02910 [Ignavibacteria bacterium GWB2_35_6b]
MKKFLKILLTVPGLTVLGVIILLGIIDLIILPWYVSSEEIVVPDLVGKDKNEAVEILEDLGLNPILQEPRFDERFKKDRVIYSNPRPGVKVKENRRVYLAISEGKPQIRMPLLTGKTLRDAQVTIERLGLVLGTAEETRSELPANTVIEQDYSEGRPLSKGAVVNLKVSIGPEVGMIRVPSLLGKSLKEAEGILRTHSLKFGQRIYISSPNLLPNTIIDQFPGEDKLVSYGDSVDVTITQSE